jgi:hypothetical protein
LDAEGPQNRYVLPPSQGEGTCKEKEPPSHDIRGVDLSQPASSSSQIPKPGSSQGSGQAVTEVPVPPVMCTMPSHLPAQPQHFLITSPPTPGLSLQSDLQSPADWAPQHSQAAPRNFGIYQKPTMFDCSSLPRVSSPSQLAQVLQPSFLPSFSLGENVPGSLAQPCPGVLNCCKDSMAWTHTHSGQCQEPLSTSDPTLCANTLGST